MSSNKKTQVPTAKTLAAKTPVTKTLSAKAPAVKTSPPAAKAPPATKALTASAETSDVIDAKMAALDVKVEIPNVKSEYSHSGNTAADIKSTAEKPPAAVSKNTMKGLQDYLAVRINGVASCLSAFTTSAAYWSKHCNDLLEVPGGIKSIDFLINMCHTDMNRAQTQGVVFAAEKLSDEEFNHFLLECFDRTDYEKSSKIYEVWPNAEYTTNARMRIAKAYGEKETAATQELSGTVTAIQTKTVSLTCLCNAERLSYKPPFNSCSILFISNENLKPGGGLIDMKEGKYRLDVPFQGNNATHVRLFMVEMEPQAAVCCHIECATPQMIRGANSLLGGFLLSQQDNRIIEVEQKVLQGGVSYIYFKNSLGAPAPLVGTWRIAFEFLIKK